MKIYLMAVMAALFCFSTNANAAPQAEKDWNFLIFLNGVNSLDEFGPTNLNQMEQLGSNEHVNILVQWGSLARPDTQRLLVKKDNDTTHVTSPVIQHMANVDMGDANSLVDFARWAHQNYPAKKTFLVVWNHGGGWHLQSAESLLGGFHANDISWDDRTGHHISTEQLGAAMREIATINGKKIDIYGSDACLMSMVEVSREMSDAVEYFVGSQDLEPGPGWPYSDFLGHWLAHPEMSSADVAKTLVTDYNASYSGGSNGNDAATLSAFDLKAQPQLDAALAGVAHQLLALSTTQLSALKTASASAKSFYLDDYKDLVDFMDKANMSTMAAGTNDLRTAISTYVIANATNEDAMTHGLSIWMPSSQNDVSSYLQRYRGLQINQATGWGDVVAKIFGH